MITAYARSLRRFNRDVCLFLITSAIFGFTAFGGIYSVILNLYLLRLGYGLEFIGLVNAGGQLAFAAFCLPAGLLSRRWGCRRMMILGLSLAAAGNTLLPLAELLPGNLRAGWLFWTYLSAWLGIAAYIVNSDPFLAGATGALERNHAFCVQAALWPLAGFAGSLVAGLIPGLLAGRLGLSLDQPAAFRYLLFAAGVLLVSAVLALLHVEDVQSEPSEAEPVGAGRPPYGLLAIMTLVVLFQVTGEGAARTFINVYFDADLHMSLARIGTLVAAGQLISVPAALLTPLLTDRLGNGRTFVWASLAITLSFIPLVMIRSWSAASLAFAGIMALNSMTRPAITVFHQELVAPRWRATMSAITTTAVGASWAGIGLAGGFIITSAGYPALFALAAIITAAGAALFGRYFRLPRAALGDARCRKDTLQSAEVT